MIDEIKVSICLLFIVIGSISIGYIYEDEIGSKIRDMRTEDVETPEECKNLTMDQTAYCLNDYVKGIFKYKSRPDKENPTLEDLIEEGGDCKNWAELYVEHIENLGFNSKRPRIKLVNYTGHTFAIISDETGYCILDQESVRCIYLETNINKTE